MIAGSRPYADAMATKGFDLFLTSGPENIFYLTGQQTPGYYTFQCLCVPQTGEPFHILRGLESMNARLNTLLADIEGYADDAHPSAALAASLTRRGWDGKRVAIDRNSWFLTVNLYERLVIEFGPLLDGSGLVEPLRRVKSKREIEQMEKSAAANDAGMRAGLDAVSEGASENDVAAAIMNAAIKAGSEYLGMDPFVTSGRALRRSAYDLAAPQDRERRPGRARNLRLLQSLSYRDVSHRRCRQDSAACARHVQDL